MKVHTSPDRFLTQISRYEQLATTLESPEEALEAQDMLEYYLESRRHESDVANLPQNGLEYALRTSQKLCEKTASSDIYSQHLYAALCNNTFEKDGVHSTYSWRKAGAIVAHMRERGDYIDWYCSGIICDEEKNAEPWCYFRCEGDASTEIINDLEQLNWKIIN